MSVRKIAATVFFVCVVAGFSHGRVDAADFRVEVSGGWNGNTVWASGEETIADRTISVTLDSVSLDGGAAFGGAFWVDRWIGEDWSIGLQYLRQNTSGSAGTTVSTILGISAGVAADVEFTLDTIFANVAWRRGRGPFHPFAGLGIGLGNAHIDLEGFARLGLGTADNAVETDTFQGGIQGFVGLDYDISDTIYVGVSANAYYIDGRPVGLDLQVLSYIFLARLGFQF